MVRDNNPIISRKEKTQKIQFCENLSGAKIALMQKYNAFVY
jgi:hypothetical protein